MTRFSAHHLIAARARRTTIAASVLASSVMLGGAAIPAGAAAGATSHGATGSYRVLSSVTTATELPGRTTELQYFAAHARYRLDHDYDRGKLEDIDWHQDVPQGSCRLDNRVLIDPKPKTWFEKRTVFAPLPPPTFGIRSTTRQVAAAIRAGHAHSGKLTTKYGQRVRLLTVTSQNAHVLSHLLWVNPLTDQPVAETKTFALGDTPNPSRTRTLTSHWENVSLDTVKQITDQPKVPAGYSVEHDHVSQSRCRR